MKDTVVIIGGIVGLIGGLAGLWSTYRPLKVTVSHLDYLGIVISANGTTWKVHLPVVISNLAKVPGVITLIRLVVKPVEKNEIYKLDWGVFWKEDSQLKRTIDRTSSPIPVPGFTCVERSIQFECDRPIQWESRLYKIELQVRTNRSRKLKTVSDFFFHPSTDHCSQWYGSNSFQGDTVVNVPIYLIRSDIPES